MVVLCANVYYPSLSNGQSCSETIAGTTVPSADYHREHGWPVPKSGLYHPSEADDTKNPPPADKQAHGRNPNSGLRPFPHFHPFIHRIHRDTRQHPLVHRTKIEIKTIPFAIFHFRGQRIVSKFITALHKFVHLHGEKLFGRQTALLAESLGGTVDTFHSFANQ